MENISTYGPEFLRNMADALEDERSLHNVERIIRMPQLDQHLLLAINKPAPKNYRFDHFQMVMSEDFDFIAPLASRLIAVETGDGNGAILGAFMTNYVPHLRGTQYLAVGIFPQYGKVEYQTRPVAPQNVISFVYQDSYRSTDQYQGDVRVRWEDATDNDPILLKCGHIDYLLYAQSPFEEVTPYQSQPREVSWYDGHKELRLTRPEPFELALESNLIFRTMWIVEHGSGRPKIFRAPRIGKFLNSHASDPRYLELHTAYTNYKKLHGNLRSHWDEE